MPEGIIECDVVVVGSGVGGVSAAARAAELGRRVVLLEAAESFGGTAMFSGGLIHIRGDKTWEEYRKRCSTADPVLAKTLFDGYEPYVQWLDAMGAPGSYGMSGFRGRGILGYQIGASVEPRRKASWFRYLVNYVELRGGTAMLRTRARQLVQTDGRITGLIADSPQGELVVRSPAVILGAGGFQNDEETLREYFGPTSADFVPRAIKYDRGDGLQMALAVGAQKSPSMNTVYGHLMPAPPARIDWGNYLDPMMMCSYYCEGGIIVNVAGERFIDESTGDLTGLTANTASQQPPGGCWVILDREIAREHGRYEIPSQNVRPTNLRHARLLPYFRIAKRDGKFVFVMDSIRLARSRGAAIISAPTLDELIRQIAAFGVDADRLRETVTSFNAAISSGQGDKLAPPRTRYEHELTTPPFLAIKVGVGISMTYGGIVINERAEVLDAARSPIAGLYAVPGTAGGIHHNFYGGSLSACGIFGKIAGEQASTAVGG